MTLAAVSFSDPLMLIGLLAAGIPILLHLLNRIRSPIVPFPTLRFLKVTAQKTSRRRQLQQWLLLLLRMAVFAMIAMAIARPLIRGGSSIMAYSFILLFLVGLVFLVLAGVWGTAAIDQSKSTPALTSAEDLLPAHARQSPPAAKRNPTRYWGLSAAALLVALLLAGYSAFGLGSDQYFSGETGTFSGRSTAAVIIFDNSHSMLARQDSASRLQRAKEQIRQLLVETVRPAEAAILPTNPGLSPEPTGLTADLTALLGSMDKLEPLGRAKPMKERIRTALSILGTTQQTHRMLIIVSDYARPAFGDADVLAAIKETPEAKETQVVLMPMATGSPPADVGIASFAIAQGGGQPVIGSEIIFEAQVINNGDAADVKDLAFFVDDQVVPSVSPRVQLGPAGSSAGRTTLKLAYRLTKAGYHRYTLKLKDTQDAMDWDNQRSLVLNVAEQIKVLVIGADSGSPSPAASGGPRPRSAAYYFQAALAPFEGLPAQRGAASEGGTPQAWSIKPVFRTVAQVTDYAALSGYAAVFLCDVPQVPATLADGLVKYSRENGRIVWILGPSIDSAQYNATLLPRELLPAPLALPRVSAMGSTVDWVDLSADVFANLFDNQEPFRSVVVTGCWQLQANTTLRGRPLSKLADGSLLITEHALAGSQGSVGGGGDIYTVLTSPAAAWSNLGSTVLLVPVASRMALGDSGRSKSETSFEPGASMLLAAATTDRSVSIDITTPLKQTLNVRSVLSGEQPRWYFDKTLSEGLYTWASSDHRTSGMFVVNPPSEEADLLPADVDALAKETGATRPAIVAATAQELLGQLEKRSEGTTLAPGILAMVLMLTILEALLANRQRPSAKPLSIEPALPSAPLPARSAA